MYDILNSRLTDKARPSPIAISDYVMRVFNSDLTRFLDWKHTDVTSVPPDHPIVSLLIHLSTRVGFAYDLTIQDIYQKTYNLTQEMARIFGFTHTSNPGRLHPLSNGNSALFIVGESPFREDVTWRTPFQDIIPIRYLSHDSTNMSLGSEALTEKDFGLGFDILEIDLGLLIVQYYLWLKDQMENFLPGEKRNDQSFVSMFVLPNTKPSQFALAFMNRITAIALDKPIDNSFYRLPMMFPDRNKIMYNLAKQLTPFILSKEIKFNYLLEVVPVPGYGNLGLFTSIPDYPPIRQIAWALLLARYNVILYLFALARVVPERAQRFPVNQIRRTIMRIKNDKGFNQTMSPLEQRSVVQKMDDLINLMGGV